MPCKSLKRVVEEELELLLEQRQQGMMQCLLFEKEEGEEDDLSTGSLDSLLDMAVECAYTNVTSNRYLFRQSKYRKAIPLFERDLHVQPEQANSETDTLHWLMDDEFLKKYRMRRERVSKVSSP